MNQYDQIVRHLSSPNIRVCIYPEEKMNNLPPAELLNERTSEVIERFFGEIFCDRSQDDQHGFQIPEEVLDRWRPLFSSSKGKCLFSYILCCLIIRYIFEGALRMQKYYKERPGGPLQVSWDYLYGDRRVEQAYNSIKVIELLKKGSRVGNHRINSKFNSLYYNCGIDMAVLQLGSHDEKTYEDVFMTACIHLTRSLGGFEKAWKVIDQVMMHVIPVEAFLNDIKWANVDCAWMYEPFLPSEE